MTSTPFSSWLPSLRAMSMPRLVKLAAWVLDALAAKLGAKGRSPSVFAQAPPPGAEVRVKLARRRRRRVARPGSHRRDDFVGAADRRTGQHRPRASVQLQHEGAERNLGQFLEAGRQLPGHRVGADPSDEPHREAVARRLGVDEDPVLVAGGRVAALLRADEDAAFEDAVGAAQGRRFDFDGADLRRRRTGNRGRGALAELASVQASRPVLAEGLRPSPSGSATCASLVFELSRFSPPTRWGTWTSVIAPEGESVCPVAGSSRCRRVVGDVFAVDRLFAFRQRRLDRRPGAGWELVAGFRLFGDRAASR